jgi:N-acyl homoserine lactone hydrolase
MRIHRLTTGRVRGPRRRRGVRRYLIADWGDETLPVNAFLIEHPRGLCLVDAGQTAAAAEGGYFPRWYPFFRLSRFELTREDEADERLRALGFAPEDVRWVVLTHLHTDHAGGLGSFRSAEVIVSATEWRRASGLGGRLRGYLPQYWPRGLVPTTVALDGPPVGPFASSHDLAGDGSLRLVPLPGHTPGQIGVLVAGAGGGALLVGDAAHDWPEFEGAEPRLADYCRREGIVFLAAHDDGAAPTVEIPLANVGTTAIGR